MMNLNLIWYFAFSVDVVLYPFFVLYLLIFISSVKDLYSLIVVENNYNHFTGQSYVNIVISFLLYIISEITLILSVIYMYLNYSICNDIYNYNTQININNIMGVYNIIILSVTSLLIKYKYPTTILSNVVIVIFLVCFFIYVQIIEFNVLLISINDYIITTIAMIFIFFHYLHINISAYLIFNNSNVHIHSKYTYNSMNRLVVVGYNNSIHLYIIIIIYFIVVELLWLVLYLLIYSL